MLEIHRPIKRETRTTFMHYGRRMVVELRPGDVLVMRLKGTGTEYTATLDAVFKQLAHWHALAETRRRREERRARRCRD